MNFFNQNLIVNSFCDSFDNRKANYFRFNNSNKTKNILNYCTNGHNNFLGNSSR